LLSNGLQPTIHHGFQAAFHQTNILAALLLQVLIMQAGELNAHLVTGVQKYRVRQIFSLGCIFWWHRNQRIRMGIAAVDHRYRIVNYSPKQKCCFHLWFMNIYDMSISI
jgi:hypothetical protein